MQPLPQKVQKLIAQRNTLRKEKRYEESDAIREKLENMGYVLEDAKSGVRVSQKNEQLPPKESFLVLFGSGETAPSAQKVHAQVLAGIGKDKPNIVILSTPAGFQPNVKVVCEEIQQFFKHHLQNYHPHIEIVYANTLADANNAKLIKPLDKADYIFAGPGSPTYAVRNLRDSLLMAKIKEHVKAGASLGLSSAATIAFSKFALPVYEIYKAGFTPYWEPGLNFYSHVFRELTIIPHFNNNEGGKKNDTSHAWMGKARYVKMLTLLPLKQEIWGIDEHTAALIHIPTKHREVLGKGKITEYNT